MSGQRKDGTAPHVEQSKRQERARRILDAAAELIQRWGYNKTTIDDIAKQAGVAKGTIYLHWKTREDLFSALLVREELALAEDIKQRIASDPEGSTLHGMMKHSTLALMKNSLMKALVLNDIDILGAWARRGYSNANYEERITNYKLFLEFLRNHGLVRIDIGIREEIYILSAICWGFLLIDPVMPGEFKFSDEEIVEMLAETVKRTFEPRDTATGKEIDAGTLQEVSNAFNQYFDQAVKAIKEDVQKEVGFGLVGFNK